MVINRKGKKLTTTHCKSPIPKVDVIQYRHPMVKMPLQNCFPQESSSLLKVSQAIVGYPHELETTTGFELGTFLPLE